MLLFNRFDRWLLNLGLLSLSLISLLLAPISTATPPPTTPPITVPPPKMNSQKVTPEAALARFFTTDSASADWFTPDFIAAIPITQIQQIVDQVKQELGTFETIQPDGDEFTLKFSKGSIPALIELTPDGKISGLLFKPPVAKVANLDAAIDNFKALPGKVSVLVKQDNTLSPDDALGVGSTFKLAVLQVLKSQIAAKKLTWETIVPLQAKYKSLPSGRLQNWPDGSVLTVQTLAAMMISESDNTATDHLIQLVGRENIEAITPKNRPFLMTRELFQLKAQKNAPTLQRYRQANLQERRSILAELAQQPLPNGAEFGSSQVKALDLEWFFTPEELCQIIDQVADLPLTGIEPGIAQPKDWQKIAYKGGSEGGVLNFTTALQAKNGQKYCVVATWNHDQPLNETKFVSLYASLLDLLK
jgi:beta-lactamase class A